jgi:hypothetical protein
LPAPPAWSSYGNWLCRSLAFSPPSNHRSRLRRLPELLAQKCEDAEDYEMAARYMTALNNAIELLPADDSKKDVPPAHITFVFNGAPPVEQKPIDEVLKDAESLLNDGEYIDYEEDPAEPTANDGSGSAGR